VSSAAPTAIRVICQPGMPPVTTVWIWAGTVTGGYPARLGLSGGGKVAHAAGARPIAAVQEDCQPAERGEHTAGARDAALWGAWLR